MPIRTRRNFCPNRARRILKMLGMSSKAFRIRYNAVTGGSAHPSDVSAWLKGTRTLPDAAVVLLKALVWCVQVSRGRKRGGEGVQRRRVAAEQKEN